jgi:hypothetical protein
VEPLDREDAPVFPTRTRHRWAAPLAAASVLTMILVLVLGVSQASARTVAPSARPATSVGSAVHEWSSGVYPGDGIDLAAANAFAAYVGRPLDNVHVFLEASTWQTIGYEQWEVRQYNGFPGQLVIDVPLLPSKQPDTLANVAAGNDDVYFRALANYLVALGRGNSVLVLGSEFNGNWQTYSAFDPPVYIAAFRHVAELLKSISPQFVIDWTGNAIDNQSGHDPFTDDYPGDDVVDLVGVDAYDYAESDITNTKSFDRWAALPYGIEAWANFAAQHDKRFSLPEWGLTTAQSTWGSPTALGSGDSAAYIRNMHEFMRRLGKKLAFEDYFNQPAAPNQNSLNGPTQMPVAAMWYKTLWGGMPSNVAAITPQSARLK